MGSVPHSFAASEKHVTGPPLLHKSVPPKAAWKSFSHLLALDLVLFEADDLLKGVESFILGPVINFDLLLVVHMLPEPVVEHIIGYYYYHLYSDSRSTNMYILNKL